MLFGNGDGTFQTDQRTTAEVSPVAIAASDFDASGRLDFAVTNVSGLDNSVNSWTVTGGDPFGGSWFAQSGTVTPSSGFTAPAPPAGTFAAMTDQSGPGQHILYQDFTVPGTGGTLGCLVFLRSSADFVLPEPETLDPFGGFENQQARVDIMDPNSAADDVGAGVLRNLLLTHPGDPGSPSNPMSGYVTIATALDAFAGQRVRLRFAEADNSNNLIFGVDDCTISAASRCVGDCNGDGAVQPDEIVVMANIALGTLDLSVCPAGAPNGAGTITVVSLVQAVDNALSGCVATALASFGRLSLKSKLAVATPAQVNRPAQRRPYGRRVY